MRVGEILSNRRLHALHGGMEPHAEYKYQTLYSYYCVITPYLIPLPNKFVIETRQFS